MGLCATCALRKLSSSSDQPCFSFELSNELKELHKFTSGLLVAFLAALTVQVPESETLLAPTLVILTFTISLRLAVSPCFVQHHPYITRIIHIIPLLGTYGLIGFQLVHNTQSPVVTTVLFITCLSPFITTIAYHGLRHDETDTTAGGSEVPHTAC